MRLWSELGQAPGGQAPGVVVVEPGDTILFVSSVALTMEEIARLEAKLRPGMGQDVRVGVVDRMHSVVVSRGIDTSGPNKPPESEYLSAKVMQSWQPTSAEVFLDSVDQSHPAYRLVQAEHADHSLVVRMPTLGTVLCETCTDRNGHYVVWSSGHVE